MAKVNPFKHLVIRSAAVRTPEVGYILAGDPKKEKQDTPHAQLFRWKTGTFNSGNRNFDCHAIAAIATPEVGYVEVSGQGYYMLTMASGAHSGDICAHSSPPATQKRVASFRNVAAIAGKAYAVGLRGTVHRLDDVEKWTRLDEGLPETFDIQAIDGFSDNDIYAVGRDGAVWQFNGTQWAECEAPTTANLTSVKCAGDGNVYVGGSQGTIVIGRDQSWKTLVQDTIAADLWDVEWFAGAAYVSTMEGVYSLRGKDLLQVDFGKDKPTSTYQLSAAPGVMWSVGEFDIMAFDGKDWTRIV